MKSIFIDCSLGISGDMIASSLFDLDIPYSLFEENLKSLKLENNLNILFKQGKSEGISGVRCEKNLIQKKDSIRSLNDIYKLLFESNLNTFVQKKAFQVFEILAKAESVVHGKEISKIHFHEIGSIDSIIDIVNVCSAFDYLKLEKVYFSIPPTGSGVVSTSHGLLPVPVPTVLEVAKQNKIPLMFIDNKYSGEITTPTGIALIAVFADKIGYNSILNIKNIGIGLGLKDISSPNFVRAMLFAENENKPINQKFNKPLYESIISQEAWIDDSTPEDVAVLIERLRSAGAIDVVCYSVDMKKNRKGICIKAIVSLKNQILLREVWFNYSTTIGLRENKINRWILPRRTVSHKTKFGEINFKQAMRPNGQVSIKIEHKDLTQISLNTGVPIEKIRQEIFIELSEFYQLDDYSF